MTTLADVSLNQVVQIDEMTLENDLKHRLQDLEMIVGSKVAVVNHSGENGIVLLHNTRLALSQSLLKKNTCERPNGRSGGVGAFRSTACRRTRGRGKCSCDWCCKAAVDGYGVD